MRLFRLDDESGESCEGVIFSDGVVVVHAVRRGFIWFYPDISELRALKPLVMIIFEDGGGPGES